MVYKKKIFKQEPYIYKCLVVDSVVPFLCPRRVVVSADRIMPILVV